MSGGLSEDRHYLFYYGL